MYKSFALLFNLNKENAKQCTNIIEQKELIAEMLRNAADRIEQGHNVGGFWIPEKEIQYDGMFGFFDQEVGFTKELDLKILNEK